MSLDERGLNILKLLVNNPTISGSQLEKEARFGFWEKYDETHTVVRIATSWGTTEEELNALIELI